VDERKHKEEGEPEALDLEDVAAADQAFAHEGFADEGLADDALEDEEDGDDALEDDALEDEGDYEGPDSDAVIAQFLAESGGGVVREAGEEIESWRDTPLPAGHKSGFVALIGRPNVGKSTLVNALVGHKVAIVSEKPQTTRSRVTGIRTEPEYQLIFVDTPGIHQKPLHRLNELMIKEAVAAIPDADAILFVVDVSAHPRDEDRAIAQILIEKAKSIPVTFVLNKMDQLPLEAAEARIESYWKLFPAYADSIPTSALNGTNVDLLLEHILAHIPEGPLYYPGDQITDQTEHQIASELIREALFHYMHEEIPHSAAVLIEEYHRREDGIFYVSARIWVDRESQKPMVIGKQGRRLKQIGSAARQELERFIGGQVYLELWVKVKPKWRDQAARLRELGY
jgi:GTPase